MDALRLRLSIMRWPSLPPRDQVTVSLVLSRPDHQQGGRTRMSGRQRIFSLWYRGKAYQRKCGSYVLFQSVFQSCPKRGGWGFCYLVQIYWSLDCTRPGPSTHTLWHHIRSIKTVWFIWLQQHTDVLNFQVALQIPGTRLRTSNDRSTVGECRITTNPRTELLAVFWNRIDNRSCNL